jgi:hypothetical protein
MRSSSEIVIVNGCVTVLPMNEWLWLKILIGNHQLKIF